jgi:hypothetical protein
LKKITEALQTINLLFDITDHDLDDYTEESLFLEYWDVQQLCVERGQHPTNQIYKLWRNRVENMQSVENDEIIEDEFHEPSYDGVHLS